jgi:hypothetical protein
MSNIRTLKKGEFLFREGDKLSTLFVVQAGSFNLCLIKGKKYIDIMQVGSSQVLGEMALMGTNVHTMTAVATTESKVLEVSLEHLKGTLESSNQLVKIFARSMLDRAKFAMSEVRANRNEKDAGPCPDEQTAQIFGGIFHTLNHKGEKNALKPLERSIDWYLLKSYCFRMFGLSSKRVENVIFMMVKMKNASVEWGKPIDNPEGADEMQKITIFDVSMLEAFFEYWQYVYFKSGRNEYLRVDENLMAILGQIVEFGKTKAVDRFGVVRASLSDIMPFIKEKSNIAVNADHFARLEIKGIFTKRHARQDGILELQFEFREMANMHRVWRMIREVDRWNEKGAVDPNETEDLPMKKLEATVSACTSCGATLPKDAKFCPSCGLKLGEQKSG